MRGRLAVVVLAALLAAALTGAFAPVAAATPDAATIDAFLAAQGSPMTGCGDVFVAEGVEYGVDPAFLVAIAGAESGFGRYLYSEDGDLCTYNAFNWFYGATRPASDFTSWDDAIAEVAEGLAGELYYGAGLCSVEAIAARYCPDGTAAWISNVSQFTVALGGSVDDTRLAAASATSAGVESGLIELEGSVVLDDGEREVGQRVYAWFRLTNSGGEAVRVDGIRLAISGPGGSSGDLVSNQALTLAPGQTTEVSASWALDRAGLWIGWIEVTRDGATTYVGESPAFSFWAKLPRDLETRRWKLRDAALDVSL